MHVPNQVDWTLHTGQLRSRTSARISVPDQVCLSLTTLKTANVCYRSCQVAGYARTALIHGGCQMQGYQIICVLCSSACNNDCRTLAMARWPTDRCTKICGRWALLDANLYFRILLHCIPFSILYPSLYLLQVVRVHVSRSVSAPAGITAAATATQAKRTTVPVHHSAEPFETRSQATDCPAPVDSAVEIANGTLHSRGLVHSRPVDSTDSALAAEPRPTEQKEYTWKVDLQRSEQYWYEWFHGMSAAFLDVKGNCVKGFAKSTPCTIRIG